ncbi:hypothetical protein GGX14DRAFT_391086 [Mycena pura]|uniref:Uncharacterized protein n=1 Tax=Mycena pura TaxID=153505 RepID=A0AAD6YHC5_9AGAR|nr:hypothetical protein GGX14DRAFT_391086 [Mycena pura]
MNRKTFPYGKFHEAIIFGAIWRPAEEVKYSDSQKNQGISLSRDVFSPGQKQKCETDGRRPENNKQRPNRVDKGSVGEEPRTSDSSGASAAWCSRGGTFGGYRGVAGNLYYLLFFAGQPVDKGEELVTMYAACLIRDATLVTTARSAGAAPLERMGTRQQMREDKAASGRCQVWESRKIDELRRTPTTSRWSGGLREPRRHGLLLVVSTTIAPRAPHSAAAHVKNGVGSTNISKSELAYRATHFGRPATNLSRRTRHVCVEQDLPHVPAACNPHISPTRVREPSMYKRGPRPRGSRATCAFLTCLCSPDVLRIPGYIIADLPPAVKQMLLDPACTDEYDTKGGNSSVASSTSTSADVLLLPAADTGDRDGQRRAPMGTVAVFAPGPGSLFRIASLWHRTAFKPWLDIDIVKVASGIHMLCPARSNHLDKHCVDSPPWTRADLLPAQLGMGANLSTVAQICVVVLSQGLNAVICEFLIGATLVSSNLSSNQRVLLLQSKILNLSARHISTDFHFVQSEGVIWFS